MSSHDARQHLAKSVEELDDIARAESIENNARHLSSSDAKKTRKEITINSAIEQYMEAERCMSDGDNECAYLCLIRFLKEIQRVINSGVYDSDHYHRDKEVYDYFMGEDARSRTFQKLALLRDHLQIKYVALRAMDNDRIKALSNHSDNKIDKQSPVKRSAAIQSPVKRSAATQSPVKSNVKSSDAIDFGNMEPKIISAFRTSMYSKLNIFNVKYFNKRSLRKNASSNGNITASNADETIKVSSSSSYDNIKKNNNIKSGADADQMDTATKPQLLGSHKTLNHSLNDKSVLSVFEKVNRTSIAYAYLKSPLIVEETLRKIEKYKVEVEYNTNKPLVDYGENETQQSISRLYHFRAYDIGLV